MSPSRSRQSLLEEIAEPFADFPPIAGILAAALLALIGWLAPLFAGTSAIAAISLQFGRWLAWLLGFFIFAYALAGAVRRALDRRSLNVTDDPARLTWSQFERLIAEFYR